MKNAILFTGIVCIVLPGEAKSDKFVVFLGQTRSHVYPILPVITELQKYSHNITLVISPFMKERLSEDGINIPYILAKSLDQTTLSQKVAALSESIMFRGPHFSRLKLFYTILKESNALCHNLMADEELYNMLKYGQFDYAIVDFLPFLCFEVLAYKLSLPFVSFGAQYDLILNRSPFNPSFMPSYFSPFTDKMTFLERVINVFLYTIQFIRPSMPSFENLVAKYVPEKPLLTNHELKKGALLYVIDGDILMDNTLPLPPNIVLCGGLAASAAKPLPGFMEAFVEKAVDGIVIVSFGSVIKLRSNHIFEELMKTFKHMKHLNFIIRYGNEQKEDENILLLPWLPQNDLLGHHKTRLLITHCGKNSLLEALYHGIPTIGFPIAFDQPMHAAIIEKKGYGIGMDIRDFTSKHLETNINKVAFRGDFKDKIVRASKIFHSRPQTPSQRAAYWIDLLTRFGPDHFRPSSMDLPWYSFYMLDVYLFFAMFILVSVYVCMKCLRCFNKRHKEAKAD